MDEIFKIYGVSFDHRSQKIFRETDTRVREVIASYKLWIQSLNKK